MTHSNDKLDLYLQLEYVDDLLAATRSTSLRDNLRELERRLERDLRLLGVADVDRFRREVHEELANQNQQDERERHTHDREAHAHGRHLAHSS